MFGIRQKLLLGFTSILAIVGGTGVLTILQLDTLGRSIDVILRENYRSVVVCQQMKESLERIDSGLLYTLAGNRNAGTRLVDENLGNFRRALDAENGNITLSGERELAERVGVLFEEYRQALPRILDAALPAPERQADYFRTLSPLFDRLKGTAQEILELNQANMNAASETARREAASARRREEAAILACLFSILLALGLAQRWIASPIKRLTASAEDIRDGHLDLVLDISTSDEIGRLARAFNDMAESLRLSRRSGQRDLIRSQRATEEVFKALPTAIALLDPEGLVEAATETARQHFGLVPGTNARDLGYEWLAGLIDQVMTSRQAVDLDPHHGFIQRFIGRREHFFQPFAHPIPPLQHGGEPAGVAVILKDVTEERQQAELKRSVMGTVSHQLKTPLTSLRMSTHLLLDETLGPLNAKQTELALAAREESERLASILEDLMDLDRLEGGRAYLSMLPVAPRNLAGQGIAPWLSEGKARGVTIVNAVPAELPQILADPARIVHVFSNLLSNALRFTVAGGSITVGGIVGNGEVRFEVRDTGSGVPPEALGRIFDRFYRFPGQEPSSGAGLGLAIVKEIVEAHGGSVGVEPAPDRGAIFWFTLPVAEAADPGGMIP